ncbi:phosphate transporter PHO1 homolog 10 isoform X1, partial [Tanacetum coccineum]
MGFALIIFLFRTVTYWFGEKANAKSTFVIIGHVFVKDARIWHTTPSTISTEEEACGLLPYPGSQQFKFLDKALLSPDGLNEDGTLSIIDDVEEAKSILLRYGLVVVHAVDKSLNIIYQPIPVYYMIGLILAQGIFRPREPVYAANMWNEALNKRHEEYNTNFLMPPQEGGESEIMFFERLDEELNKVNTFYRDKVEEVIEEAASLNKQMNSLIALRIKVKQPSDTSNSHSYRNMSKDSSSTKSPEVNSPCRIDLSENKHTDLNINVDRTNNHGQDPLDILDRMRMNNTLEDPMSTIRSVLNDSKDKDLRFKKAELKEAEGRLKVSVEFYHKLHLLKHYSYVNLQAFSKILKKFEKVAERRATRLPKNRGTYHNLVVESFRAFVGEQSMVPDYKYNFFLDDEPSVKEVYVS